ncbi:MAG: ketopantoate reductase family protein [Anaerofustis sp.]
MNRQIHTVSIIGMGALGVLYASRISEHLPKTNLRVIADQSRIDRYEAEGLYCNDKRCDFQYVLPKTKSDPADLVIFAVKFRDLQDAISVARNQIGPDTIIISLLNGIISEEIIAETYGMNQIVFCVAQGMDAVKMGNKLTYHQMGELCFGTYPKGAPTDQVLRVADFLDRMQVPYSVKEDMAKHLWGKFMLNVGVNQTVAVYRGNYGTIQREGEACETMIAAMKEAIRISESEGTGLCESDLTYWLNILDTLNPEGMPSLRQDTLANRPTEVGLFAGTVLALAKKHGMDTPVNQMLYDRITEIEQSYGK